MGGLDIDGAILDYFRRTYPETDSHEWRRLRAGDTVEDRRSWRQLSDDVRMAKEMQSRASQPRIHIPLPDQDALLGREQLDTIAIRSSTVRSPQQGRRSHRSRRPVGRPNGDAPETGRSVGREQATPEGNTKRRRTYRTVGSGLFAAAAALLSPLG